MSSTSAALEEMLSKQEIDYVLAQFVDIDGVPKGKLVPRSNAASLIDIGAGFAGPSIEGTGLPRHGARSEFYGRADVATARPIPWDANTLHVICDGFVAGTPFEGCSRQTLKRAVAALAARGYTLQVGIEPEFFLFVRAASGELYVPDAQDQLPKPSYDLKSLLRNPVANCLRELTSYLQGFGLDVLQIDHEDAPGQYEVNFCYADALSSADNFTRFKLAAHAAAEANGLVYSGMAKPFADRPGSGLHFHLSLTDAKRKAVWDAGDGNLNEAGKHALGGLLHNASALTAFHAPTVNSYKRLTGGGSQSGTTWAPVEIGWGTNNRTVPARVTAGRIEWRIPDPTCNVYLALASVIWALLDGVDNKRSLGEATETDAYENGANRKKLPNSLAAAIDALDANTTLRSAIGSHICEQFMATKRAELAEFDATIHPWEWTRYGDRF